MKQVRFNNVVLVKYFKKEDIIKTKPKYYTILPKLLLLFLLLAIIKMLTR